jgi:hypothetical protein
MAIHCRAAKNSLRGTSPYIFSDDGGYTFLQYACDMGYDEIVDYLLGKAMQRYQSKTDTFVREISYSKSEQILLQEAVFSTLKQLDSFKNQRR